MDQSPAHHSLCLTKNFKLSEMTDSQEAARRGIDNTPSAEVMGNLLELANWLENLRRLIGNRAILISSGYRSPALNTAVKGSRKSKHMRGLAADFTAPTFGSPLGLCRFIADSPALAFDELIYEGTWVHVGLSDPPSTPTARRVLTARFVRGQQTTYAQGLPA
jgi:zinc D-Ala-D-Ala carboxypeptidase